MNFYSKNFLLIITTYYVRYNIIGDEINLIIGISTDSARVSPHFAGWLSRGTVSAPDR